MNESSRVYSWNIERNYKDEEKFLGDYAITDEDLISQCNKCELRFVSESVMRYHKFRQHGEKLKRSLCKLCDWLFKNSDSLKIVMAKSVTQHPTLKIASRTTGARGSNLLETSNNILLHRTKVYKI